MGLRRITISHERKTYIKGRLTGKYVGYLNPIESNFAEHNVYDLEILNGVILVSDQIESIQKWDKAEKFWKNQLEKEPTYKAKIPESLPIKLSNESGETQTFNVTLNDKKLQNITLSKQVYDGEKVYGDISADISGFVKHFDQEEITVIDPPDPPFKTKERTGKFEKKDSLIRHEYFYSDRSTYWGPWEQPRIATNSGCWGVLSELFGLLLLGLSIVTVIAYGWRILLPIAVMAGVIYLVSFLGRIVFDVFRWLFYLASLAFLLALGTGLLSLMIGVIESPRIKPTIVQDEEEEVTQTQYNPILQDSLIVQHRIWQDYQGNTYEMKLKVRKTDFLSAKTYRNNLNPQGSADIAYNQMANQLSKHDDGNLDLVYESLDSLKQHHNLNSKQFAEVVVSMVQDIPYTLILPKDCNALSYSDSWLRDYLRSRQACEGGIKFGILSPVEFIGSLNGDCDTRTLLLYTLLSYYDYDVVMLKSEIYMHSILGVDIPSNGQTKVINGKSYVLWETTAKNIPPGFIDQEMSNLSYWKIALIH